MCSADLDVALLARHLQHVSDHSISHGPPESIIITIAGVVVLVLVMPASQRTVQLEWQQEAAGIREVGPMVMIS